VNLGSLSGHIRGSALNRQPTNARFSPSPGYVKRAQEAVK